jgi:hypothetical protein
MGTKIDSELALHMLKGWQDKLKSEYDNIDNDNLPFKTYTAGVIQGTQCSIDLIEKLIVVTELHPDIANKQADKNQKGNGRFANMISSWRIDYGKTSK